MRRFLALATSSFLLMPSLALAIAAPLSVTVGGQVMVFNDVPSDAWYAADLETAVTAGVVSGYKNA
ncbi:MAG TPA: S-layer homology domain-containing protein, partial [Candidatus Peribacteria bacterium]|nr:S-layer homology domain-containing protein [Candidatus Peribacteria bacterium]